MGCLWFHGKMVDVCYGILHVWTPTHHHTSIHAASAAEGAEIRKHKKYSNLSNRFVFVPVAVETSGSWGKEGLQLMNLIGRKIGEVTGEKRSTSYLLQRLSIVIQRGNVSSILGCLPAGKDLNEVFFL